MINQATNSEWVIGNDAAIRISALASVLFSGCLRRIEARIATENLFLLDVSAGFWSIHPKNPEAQPYAITASRSSKARIRIPF